MEIKDLPESVTFNLDEDSGISYPVSGNFETAYQLELMCFGKKFYSRTWPLRQALMQAFTAMSEKLENMVTDDQKKASQGEDKPMSGEELQTACMIGGFNSEQALVDFKNAIVANDLIKIDDGVFLKKQRWENNVDSYTQEQIMFEYLANFIQPCVLTGKSKN